MPAHRLPPSSPVVLTCLAVALLTGCSTTEVSGAASPAGGTSAGPAGDGVELVRGAACGEVTFWAASESGEVVVTVTVDVADRPAGEPSEFGYELPDPAVLVTVHSGPGDLSENFCTDVLLGPEPTLRQDVVAGTVALTVDPPGEDCGDSDGRLRVEGLVAEDGTTFAPIDVSSGLVGCNVGG
ncbi:hypothetical protein [Trujillonella endophytica]|uniref:Uncharacterized protein n=1 Tax=Trujillonella endophytica TaxID=673521 RepID=A0A1H8UW89_9ACTN|nr:hypothetical protein [Trujillella endophytica]SEP07480.1 hypothetical protein SAMN05660991_03154 [Trujillella endophytica]